MKRISAHNPGPIDVGPGGEFRHAARCLDARGLLCPEPVLLARAQVREMRSGELLHVVLTDPHGPLDFEVMCLRTGNALLDRTEDEGIWHLLVRAA